MITCHQSDYLEIACIYRIPVLLAWGDGREVVGVPRDTGYNDQKQECLLMQIDDHERWIVLEGVASMTALQENEHFDRVEFG